MTTPILPALLSFAFGFITALLADPIRQRLFAPRLALTLGAGEDFLTNTPEVRHGRAVQATYLRIRATNTSFRLAKQCRAFLTDVKRLDEAGKPVKTVYCDSIQLAWSVREGDARFGPQDLAQDVPYFFDLASFYDGTDQVYPRTLALPYRYESIFQGAGGYLFTVVLSGDGVKPTKVVVSVHWTGDRSTLIAKPAA